MSVRAAVFENLVRERFRSLYISFAFKEVERILFL